MTTKGIIVLVIFALLWVWTVYEMHVAPEVDDNGNIIKDKMKFDITEEDINGDLNCMYGKKEE